MDSREEMFNRKSLRNALRNWDRSEILGDHPLSRLRIVECKRLESGFGETGIGYGIALREVLQDVIHELMPEDSEPEYLQKRWRPFLILSEQFIRGRNPDYIAELLGIARSTYNHEQARAFDLVIDSLNQREEIQSSLEIEDKAQPDVTAPAGRIPFLAPPRSHYAMVGRNGLLRDLKDQLISGRGSNVAAIFGLPGVGKTTLATALAHDAEVLAHFGDGVLWVGLGRQPDVMALLSLWGGALGLPMQEISKLLLLEERAQAIHAAIGTRRMLLVIDDVWESAEGLAFKVGGPNCRYLITTRLPGIALEFAGEGAKPIHELDLVDGLRLLAQFTPNFVDHDPEEARALVEDVGGLPLALVLIGKYLQREGGVKQTGRLRRALDRLRLAEERMRITQMPSPLEQQPSLPVNTPLSLHAVIAISDEALDESLQRTLLAFSVFPPKPNTFNEEAALHVAQVNVGQLDQLVDSGLVEPCPPGRFTLHHTIAEYAQMKRKDRTAEEGFVNFFVGCLDEHEEEIESIDLELKNIFAALTTAKELGMHAQLIRGANHLFPFIEAKGLFTLAEEHLQNAELAAREIGEREGLLNTLLRLGNIAHRRGDYLESDQYYKEALELGNELDSEDLLGEVYKGLGIVAFSSGRYEDAENWFREGLKIATALKDITLESALLANFGVLLFNLGNHSEAERHIQKGLRLARALEDRETVSRLLINLGVMAARRWEYEDAEMFFQESLELARGAGRRDTMSFLLTNLGTLANDQGRLDLAESYFQEGLSLAREVNDRARASHLLANLGALANANRNFARALSYLEEGLDIAREIGHRENVCLLLTNQGVLLRDKGEFKKAGVSFEEALNLAQEMGHRRYSAIVLSNQGELLYLQEAWESAIETFQSCLEIAEEIQLEELIAVAYFGLARVAVKQGNRKGAIDKGKQSLLAFQEIHHPKADEVEGWLASLYPDC
jgi:tetratricopeptide (TPR) repeat protein